MKEAVVNSKQNPKKRPYDNSNRAANASGKKSGVTFKEQALDPTRLASLQKKAECKCFLADTWCPMNVSSLTLKLSFLQSFDW